MKLIRKTIGVIGPQLGIEGIGVEVKRGVGEIGGRRPLQVREIGGRRVLTLAVLHGLLLLLPLAALPVLDGLVVKQPRRPLAALAIRLYELMSGLVVMLGLVIATGHRVRREMRCIGFGQP